MTRSHEVKDMFKRLKFWIDTTFGSDLFMLLLIAAVAVALFW